MIAIDHLERSERFTMLSWAVAPRPIAWVSSMSLDGTRNLAPFSFFTIASTDPLVLMIAIEPRADGTPKDTLANVMATGQLVVHIVDVDRIAEVARTAEESEATFDELADLSLPTTDALVVDVPVVDDCIAVFECVLVETRRMGYETLVFARVVAARVDERVMAVRDRITPEAIRPLGRIGSTFTDAARIDAPQVRRRAQRCTGALR